MKSVVYGTPVMLEENLITRVHRVIESLTRQPHLLGHVREVQHRRSRILCNEAGGTQFESHFVMYITLCAAHVRITVFWDKQSVVQRNVLHKSYLILCGKVNVICCVLFGGCFDGHLSFLNWEPTFFILFSYSS